MLITQGKSRNRNAQVLFHVSVVFCLLTSQSEIFPWGWSPEVEQKTPPSAEYMQGHTLQSVDTELDLVSKG